MDQLRQLKSKIEGSYYQLPPQPTFDPAQWSQLQQLVQLDTPGSLSELHKANLAQLLSDLLKDHVKKVLYSCLMTCPWLAATQCRLADQARNNHLFVVYVARDEEFFSLATHHEKTLADVINKAGFVALPRFSLLPASQPPPKSSLLPTSLPLDSLCYPPLLLQDSLSPTFLPSLNYFCYPPPSP